MARLIIFLDKLIYLYLCFIMITGLLSWIPNINPNYPFFNVMFKLSGFYLLPPFMGMIYSPVIIMLICVFMSLGLKKLYKKYYEKYERKIVVLTPEQLVEQLQKQQKEYEDKKDVGD